MALSDASQARTVADVLRLAALECPGRIAIEQDGGGAMSYAEWDRRASRLGRALLERGVRPGDRVALLFSNGDALGYAAAYFAVHKAGAVAVPIGVRLAAAEVRAIVGHAEPRVALAEAAFAPLAAEAGLAALDPRAADGQPDGDLRVEQGPDDLADILYTSGTTGAPRGVACSHANVVALFPRPIAAFAGTLFLHAIPLTTFAGAHAMTFMPLVSRMTALVMPRFDAARWLDLVAARRVPLSYVVPAMARLIADSPPAARDLSSLRVLLFGTAPMPDDTVGRLRALLPEAFLVNVYGSTEAGAAATSLAPGMAYRPGCVGKPIPPTELRVLRDDGAPCAAGDVGRVWLRSSAPPRSYYRDEAATARTWRDGWVDTGDLGHLDADGALFLDDRAKDLAIRGGYNVYTAEVDAVLESHPAVREVAVVGVPHPVLGEDLCAFVALRDGEFADDAELRAHCLARLADYKSPRRYVFVDALPRSPLGKVLKKELRARV